MSLTGLSLSARGYRLLVSFFLSLVLSWILSKIILQILNPPGKMSFSRQPAAKVLFDTLLDRGFSFIQAEYITAQAAHETGNFTSPVFLRNNNPFGMKYGSLREMDALPDRDLDGYANYKDLNQAVNDFFLYYKYFNYRESYPDLESYIVALKERGYFEADLSAYLKSVQWFYKKYFE